MKKVLVLTSGGDSSGMNAYIKALTKMSKNNDIKLYGCLYGFRGLITKNFIELNYDEMSDIENLGGSVIKTSRSKDFMTNEGFNEAVNNIVSSKFDCVIVVGGNGSFMGAKKLSEAGINIIAIPGTIDNDLFYTDKTLGYDTACQNAVDAIAKIKQTMSSSDRGVVFEVMGRHCPDIAIHSAILSNADLLITKPLKKEEILHKVDAIISNGVLSPVIIVQENLLDVNELAVYLEQKTGKEFRSTIIGYIQRGGEPTANDKMFAIQLAISTVKKILGNVLNYAIGYKDGVIISEKIDQAVEEMPKEDNALMRIYLDYNKRS